jgi:hypothetical protein
MDWIDMFYGVLRPVQSNDFATRGATYALNQLVDVAGAHHLERRSE